MTAGHVRRVVLGTNEHGRSCVVHDGDAPVAHRVDGEPGYALIEVWAADASASVTTADPTLSSTGPTFDMPAGATRFQVVDFPPGDGFPPLMHSTETIDYLVVIEGKIRLLLHDGAVDLFAGDVVVQLGNEHAWETLDQSACRIAFVNVGIDR